MFGKILFVLKAIDWVPSMWKCGWVHMASSISGWNSAFEFPWFATFSDVTVLVSDLKPIPVHMKLHHSSVHLYHALLQMSTHTSAIAVQGKSYVLTSGSHNPAPLQLCCRVSAAPQTSPHARQSALRTPPRVQGDDVIIIYHALQYN